MASAASYPPLGGAPASSRSDPSVPNTLKHTNAQRTAEGLGPLSRGGVKKCLTDASVKAGDENTWSPSPVRAQPITELAPALFPIAWKWLSEQLDRYVWSHQLSLAPKPAQFRIVNTRCKTLNPSPWLSLKLYFNYLRCLLLLTIDNN